MVWKVFGTLSLVALIGCNPSENTASKYLAAKGHAENDSADSQVDDGDSDADAGKDDEDEAIQDPDQDMVEPDDKDDDEASDGGDRPADMEPVTPVTPTPMPMPDPTPDPTPTPTPEASTFVTIRTKVFEPYCLGCHGQAGGNKGGVNLETYAKVKPLLADIKSSTVDRKTMPKGQKMDDESVKLLADWIAAGAKEK